MEQRVVPIVCFCGYQLHEKLGLRCFRSGRVLGRSLRLNDGSGQILKDRPPAQLH